MRLIVWEIRGGGVIHQTQLCATRLSPRVLPVGDSVALSSPCRHKTNLSHTWRHLSHTCKQLSHT